MRVRNVGWGADVHHLGRGVAQHALGPNVENLDHPLGIGGNAGEIGTVKNGFLQSPSFHQRFFSRLAGGDVAQDAGEIALAAQRHLTDSNLQRKSAAVLALPDHLAANPNGTGLFADPVIVQRHVVLLLVEFRNQQTQVFARQLCRAVAKHDFNGGVDGLNDATMGMNGHQAIDHGVKNGLHQCRTVAQSLLHRVFHRDIAKHQHSTHHLTRYITNRRAAV